jgi:uncharacterized membrane protein YfcA
MPLQAGCVIIIAVTAAAAIVAGGIASVTGFGIGSLLTPLFNLRDDMPLAVAAVSIPHAVATSLRLWILRANVDRGVLKSFGLMSAAGGLIGAVLQRYATGRSLALVFATLLTFAGAAGLTGFSERLRLGRTAGWIAGVVSGALGGLVGNQGGIRSAALLGYDLSPAAFVATATAAGLIVDAARVPVYVVAEHSHLVERADIIAMATLGVVVGTIAGGRILKTLPASVFRQLVGGLVLLLGCYMFSRA